MTNISRRDLVTLLSLAAAEAYILTSTEVTAILAGAPTARRSSAEQSRVAPSNDIGEPVTQEEKVSAAWRLVAPLKKGSDVAGLILAAVSWDSGSLRFELKDLNGTAYQVRVCSKDHGQGGPLPI